MTPSPRSRWPSSAWRCSPSSRPACSDSIYLGRSGGCSRGRSRRCTRGRRGCRAGRVAKRATAAEPSAGREPRRACRARMCSCSSSSRTARSASSDPIQRAAAAAARAARQAPFTTPAATSCPHSSNRRPSADPPGSRTSRFSRASRSRDPDANALLMTEQRPTVVTNFARRGYRTIADDARPVVSVARRRVLRVPGHLQRPRLDYQGSVVRLVGHARSVHAGQARRAGSVERPSRPPLFVFFPTVSTHTPFTPTAAVSAGLAADADADSRSTDADSTARMSASRTG